MSFIESVRTCLSKYVTFSGRAARPEYWWFALFYFLVVIAFSIIDSAIFGIDTATQEPRRVLTPLVQLALFLPLLAAGWRRMHDSGRSGKLLLLPMIVSLGITLMLFLGIFTFGAMENAGADPDALRESAAVIGITGLIVASIVQLVLAILMLWWLTRPSEPQTNDYGPVPGGTS